MGEARRSAVGRLGGAWSWRRAVAELGLFTLAGLVIGAIGPFGTANTNVSPWRLYLYWLACIVGGGVIGVTVDELLGRRAGGFWSRLALTSVTMTPAVSLLVVGISQAVLGQPIPQGRVVTLLWQVWLISVSVMALRALTWRPLPTRVETRIVVAPPLPEAGAAFRRRLSARRRGARLIAVEAYDHYLRIHTDAGAELVTARFAEALKELAGAPGFQTHRSWWVAADAIEAVRWRRGSGEARLAEGVVAPVSRTHAPALRAAGWI